MQFACSENAVVRYFVSNNNNINNNNKRSSINVT